MPINKSVGRFLGDVTEPFTQRRAKQDEFDLVSKSLDSLAQDIHFQQSLGGISTGKPFQDIENVRSESRRRLKSSSAFSSLIANALFSTFADRGISFGQKTVLNALGKQR